MRLFFSCLLIVSFLACKSTKTRQEVRPRDKMDAAVMESRRGNHSKALSLLDEIIKEEPERWEAYARRATVLFESNRKKEGLQAMETLMNQAPDFDPEVYYSAGVMAMELEEFKSAEKHFAQYLNHKNIDVERRKKAESWRMLAVFRATPPLTEYRIYPKPVKGYINTEMSEYLPSLTLDQENLIFTRRVNGQEDLFLSTLVDSIWSEAREIGSVNTRENEGAQTISSDGNLIIFTACNRRLGVGGCDLYQTRLQNGRWTEPIVLDKNINTPAWESQPCLSADGRSLFYCSNRVEGIGNHDIWVSKKDHKGDWMPGINLGPVINTPGDEESPFIHPDGKTLFFRSNTHPGMGSFDLFVSEYDVQTGSWSKPLNLGQPINTSANEGALYISPDGKTAYFASDFDYVAGQGRKSHLDIYQFELPDHLRPNPVTYVRATVVDAVTKEPLQAEVSLVNTSDSDTLIFSADEQGEFLAVLPSGNEFILSVDEPGYVFYLKMINLRTSANVLNPYHLNIGLLPLPKEEEEIASSPIVLNNILFESGSARLKPESATEISKLAELLFKQNSLDALIIGHTDSEGEDADNEILSKDRANAVVEALVQRGIAPGRLTAIGKGESEPIAGNDTPEGRALNRRTELVLKRKNN